MKTFVNATVSVNKSIREGENWGGQSRNRPK